MKNVLVYLDDMWQKMLEQSTDAVPLQATAMVNEIMEVFRNLELESGKRQKINELQTQKLNEEEELSALEELLNQTRQRQGL